MARGSRGSLLTHVFFCTTCDIWDTAQGDINSIKDADVTYIKPPNRWRLCDVGNNLMNYAMLEDPSKDI